MSLGTVLVIEGVVISRYPTRIGERFLNLADADCLVIDSMTLGNGDSVRYSIHPKSEKYLRPLIAKKTADLSHRLIAS
jgi:hypothetical protein